MSLICDIGWERVNKYKLQYNKIMVTLIENNAWGWCYGTFLLHQQAGCHCKDPERALLNYVTRPEVGY
jgi:hypothetical protein